MPLSIWPPCRARSAPLPYASAHTLPPVRRSELSSPTQPAPGMGRTRAQAGARDSKCKANAEALHTRAPAATPRWPAPSAGPPSRPRSRRPGRRRRPCCWGLVVCARVSGECRAGRRKCERSRGAARARLSLPTSAFSAGVASLPRAAHTPTHIHAHPHSPTVHGPQVARRHHVLQPAGRRRRGACETSLIRSRFRKTIGQRPFAHALLPQNKHSSSSWAPPSWAPPSC